jgi:tetratricopeptide (TPR) repeat protein
MSQKKNTRRKTRGSRVSRKISGVRVQSGRSKAPGSPREIIDLAEATYFKSDESAVCDILAPLTGEAHLLDATDEARYLALLALGNAHANRLIDAETAAEKLSSLRPLSPDTWFVLTYVHISMREYTKAMAAGKKYAVCMSQLTDSVKPAYCISNRHRSQVFNMLAVACKESGQVDEAIGYYRQSIEADRGNHLPYLNLAALFTSIGRRQEAGEIIKAGVKQARQVHELRMLQQSAQRHGTVSACMIVKNEEELLGDCLASIRDWVDEIIVVDTGSTDRTVEIAESYGSKVFHHPWEGDFSKARNQSLSYATGEWIFIIDADERMYSEDIPELQRLLRNSRVEVISINVYNVYGENESGVTFLPSTRLFRRSLGLRYDGIVHNVLVYSDTQPIERTGVRLKHLGYGLDKEKMREKLKRSRELLEKQLAESPDNAFALFNYAQLLRGETATFPAQNAELILKSARHAVKLTNPALATERHIHLMCLDQIAWTLFHQGNYDQAEEQARKAIAYKPNYLDPLLLLGHIAARKQQYDQARLEYLAYLKAQAEYDPGRETDNIIMMHVDSRVSAWYSLGMIAEIQGSPNEAIRYYESIVEKDPSYLDTSAHLGRLALQRHDLAAAEQWYRLHLKSHADSIDGYRQLGQILTSAQQPAQAADIFRQGLGIEGNDIACLIGLGRTESELGRHTQAAECFQKASQVDPENRAVPRELASVFFKSGRFAEAAEIYRELAESGSANADLLNDLGNCHFKMEQYDAAERAYRDALAWPEHIPSVWRNLGLTLLRRGDLEGACSSLQRYIGFHPEAVEVTNMLADIHFRHGRYNEALGFLEKYLTVKPDDTSALFMLSECYLHMGHQESAVIGYRRILKLDPGFSPAGERLSELLTPAATR